MHRGAALEIVDSANITISHCLFDQTGGNAVLMSRGAVQNTIVSNEFHWTGDSAVLALGVSDGILGDAPTYPDRNVIRGNHFHEIGMFGKQVSCFGQVWCNAM